MIIEKIAIASHESVLYINIYDLVYCQSEGLSISIFLANGQRHIVNKQLSKVQGLLPDIFIRISQCVIINKLYLNKIEKKEKLICMEGNIKLSYTMALGKLVDRIGSVSSRNIRFSNSFIDDGVGQAVLEIA